MYFSMSDISHIFGGEWSPPKPKPTLPPEDQLRHAMLEVGIKPPDDIRLDGKMHRFNSGTKGDRGHDKPGWYIAFADGVPAGRFGCWRLGVELTWQAEIGRSLTVAESMALTKRMAEAKAQRDVEIAKKREVATNTVELIWSQAAAASAEHPYLARKGIETHGARITGDGRLIVPLYSADGELSSLQYITADGAKKYHDGGATGSMYWVIGSLDEPGTIYIAEGFATAATVSEETGCPCIVAYSASNLVPVAGIIKEQYKYADICIVADNDASGVGQRYAEQASAKHGVRMVMTPESGDANDYVQAGNDLMLLLSPPVSTEYLVRCTDFASKPAPISWLVKGWLQEQALVMVHGPSGGGKTFVVLDWMMHIAAGKPLWFKHKTKHGKVVYLAGEGHHGLKGRLAAWMHHNEVFDCDLWVSKSGCDLNTPDGYKKVVEAIRHLKIRPDVITVDTLHRFLLGDENSAQDAKTMLDACAALMHEFQCSVILVHHTGVSEDAQHRARGSSAWRGALDIEVSIVPSKDDQSIQIIQRKSKDAEMVKPVYVDLESVEIPDWFDEDGEPVTSAVVVEGKNPPKDSQVKARPLDTFEKAWFASGCEDIGGSPYLSRSAMKLYCDQNELNQRTEDNRRTKLIKDGILQKLQDGWIVIDGVESSVMMMKK